MQEEITEVKIAVTCPEEIFEEIMDLLNQPFPNTEDVDVLIIHKNK